jgi:hypothetical protein
MTCRNPDAQKNPPGPASPRGESNPDASEILPNSRPLWAMRGQHTHGPVASPNTSAPSVNSNPAHETDEAALAVCFDKRGLARFLGLSVRSLDRANAAGLLPCPDLICGRSPRWSPPTIGDG